MTLGISLQVADLKIPVSRAALTCQLGAAPELRLLLAGSVGGDRLVGAEGVVRWQDGSAPILILGSAMLPGAPGIEVRGVVMGRATRERLGRQIEAGGRTLVLQRRHDQSTTDWLRAMTGGLIRDKDLGALAANVEPAFPALSVFARSPHHTALQSTSAALSALNANWRLTEDASGHPVRATPAGMRRPLPSRVTPAGTHHDGTSDAGVFHFDVSIEREPKGLWIGLLAGGTWPTEDIAEPGPATWKGLDVEVRSVEVTAAADHPIRVHYTVGLAQLHGSQVPHVRNSAIVDATIGAWTDGPKGLISVRPTAGWAVLSADGTKISEDPIIATLLMPAFGQGDDRVGLYVPPLASDGRVLLVDGALPVTLGSPQVHVEIGAASAVLGKSVALAGVVTVTHDAVQVHTKMTVEGDIQLKA